MTIRESTHKNFLKGQLKNPVFREAWEASEPAYQLKRLRILKKLSQADLRARSAPSSPASQGWKAARA